MARNRKRAKDAPTHDVIVALDPSPGHRSVVGTRFNAGLRVSNACLAEALKRTGRMRDDPAYETARRLPKKTREQEIQTGRVLFTRIVRTRVNGRWAYRAQFVVDAPAPVRHPTGDGLVGLDSKRATRTGTQLQDAHRQRQHRCPVCGFRAQRDVLSAFLARHVHRDVEPESEAVLDWLDAPAARWAAGLRQDLGARPASSLTLNRRAPVPLAGAGHIPQAGVGVGRPEPGTS